MNYKDIGEFPPVTKLTPSYSELDYTYSKYVDVCPKELQRDEVLSPEWASKVTASIYLGVTCPKWTWSLQKEIFDGKSIYGKPIKAKYKNLDSLQRHTQHKWWKTGVITLPPDVKVYFGGRVVNIGGLDYDEIEKKYPGLNDTKYNQRGPEIDIYGIENGQVCTPKQESYLFKQVLNNANKMTSQQWRNPTVSSIASTIRDDARLNAIPLFLNDLFKFSNEKMDYDEVYAMINHYIIYGTNKGLTKNPLDDMYEHNSLEYNTNIHSTVYGKSINVNVFARRYANFMYQILKDKDNKKLMDKSYVYSLIHYTHIHMRLGHQNIFDYEKLKKQFFDLHLELIEPPVGGGDSIFRKCLRGNGVENLKIELQMWEELLELDKEVKYVIFRDSKRNFTTAQITRALKRQGWIDPIDGLPLSLADAIGGHNVAWSKGGLTILDNCIAIRKEYNDDMGTKTLEEYKEELETIS